MSSTNSRRLSVRSVRRRFIKLNIRIAAINTLLSQSSTLGEAIDSVKFADILIEYPLTWLLG